MKTIRRWRQGARLRNDFTKIKQIFLLHVKYCYCENQKSYFILSSLFWYFCYPIPQDNCVGVNVKYAKIFYIKRMIA